MRRCLLVLLLALAALGAKAEPQAEPQPPAPSPAGPSTLCGALAAAATRNGLPFPFFTRLIWQESRFDPGARSPAGAEGVAQFMPSTAAERGLADPFDATRALDESAAYLRDLRQQFGNLGLAAAAYNAGPGRLAAWIAGRGGLPRETINYVEIVTGHGVDEWRGPAIGADAAPALAPEPGFSCIAFTREAGRRRAPAADNEPGMPPPKAWAVILGGGFNRGAVLAEYAVVRANLARRLGTFESPVVRRRHLGGQRAKKYVVQIENDDRASSNRMCKRFADAGGNCIVLRNILR